MSALKLPPAIIDRDVSEDSTAGDVSKGRHIAVLAIWESPSSVIEFMTGVLLEYVSMRDVIALFSIAYRRPRSSASRE